MKKNYILYISFLIQIILCNDCFAIETISDSTAILKERTFDSNFKNRYEYNYEGKAIKKKNKHTVQGENSPYSNGKIKDIEDSNNNNFNFSGGGVFQIILIAAFVIALVVLAFILAGQGVKNPFSNRKSKNIEDNEDFTPEDIENTNIETLIKKAENNGNYRLAIRYQYLSVLKSLSTKELIEYKEDKTNAQYQAELSDVSYSKDFSYISYLYNYVWYGEFYINDSEYSIAKNNFSNLIKSIK